MAKEKEMQKVLVVTAVLALLCVGGLAHGDVFNLGPGLTDLEMVPVGDPGNAADATGFGSVGYVYRIGRYEVTIAQYADFLNNKAKTDPYGLYFTSTVGITRSGYSGNYTYSVTSGYANRPMNVVAYWDACRFVNWLHNGQGNGDTETGAYTLDGYTGADGGWVQRNPGATWYLPSESEWYKAAYYKGGGQSAGYWDCPTMSDSVNVTMANYGSSVGHTTDVASYAYPSAYGTFDQGGNVWEWTETFYPSPLRVTRGGSFDKTYGALSSAQRYNTNPASYYTTLGFRVAAVPEPSGLLILANGLLALAGMIRKKR